MHLIFPVAILIGLYIYAADSVGLSSFQFVQCAPKAIFSATDSVLALQGYPSHSKVDDFGTIKSACANSYQSVIIAAYYGRPPAS